MNREIKLISWENWRNFELHILGGYICPTTLWVSIWKSLGKTKPCALDQYTIKMYLRTFSCSRVALFYHWKVFNVIMFSAEPFPNYIIKMYLTRVSENECIWEHSVVPDLLFFWPRSWAVLETAFFSCQFLSVPFSRFPIWYMNFFMMQ